MLALPAGRVNVRTTVPDYNHHGIASGLHLRNHYLYLDMKWN